MGLKAPHFGGKKNRKHLRAGRRGHFCRLARELARNLDGIWTECSGASSSFCDCMTSLQLLIGTQIVNSWKLWFRVCTQTAVLFLKQEHFQYCSKICQNMTNIERSIASSLNWKKNHAHTVFHGPQLLQKLQKKPDQPTEGLGPQPQLHNQHPQPPQKLQSQINQPMGWAHNHNCTTNTHNYKNYKATWQPTEGLGPAPLHHLMSASRALLLATEVSVPVVVVVVVDFGSWVLPPSLNCCDRSKGGRTCRKNVEG